MAQSYENSFDHYQIVVEEEHYFLSEHQRRIAFFSGFITTLLAATFAGFVASDKWLHYYLLSALPVAIIAISYIAKRGIGRLYQRFLETITVRAKLEELLGYTENPPQDSNEEGGWSTSEPIVTKRHLRSRVDPRYETSEEWVNAHLRKRENYHGVTMLLFNTFIIIGVVMFFALLVIGGCFLISDTF